MGLLLSGAVVVVVGLLVAPQAFAGPLGGLRGGGGGPLAGLRPGGGKAGPGGPFARLRPGGNKAGGGLRDRLRGNGGRNGGAGNAGGAGDGGAGNGSAGAGAGDGGAGAGAGAGGAGDDQGIGNLGSGVDGGATGGVDGAGDDLGIGNLGSGVDGGTGAATKAGAGTKAGAATKARAGTKARVAGAGDAVNAGGCADVHIIATRASSEKPGAGIIGSLVERVSAQSSQSVSTEATDYPAVLDPYARSVATGVVALTRQLRTRADACPGQKVVLMGYSQGANVIGDVLGGGGGGALGAKTPPADRAGTDQVAAVILMGDPRHVAGESFDAGTATGDGRFPRGDDQSLDAFADRIQSYCDTGDPFCAGGRSVDTHLGYTRKYNAEAADFVLRKIGG